MSRRNSSLPDLSGPDHRVPDDPMVTRPDASDAGPDTDQQPSRTESCPQEVRIRTGARLHFGLLDTVPPFGGAGVMIEDPATDVIVTADDHTGCTGDLRQRVDPIVRRVAARRRNDFPFGAQVRLIDGPPRHSGFGSGTQFSLAVAEALCRIAAIDPDPHELAIELADRGRRSAVGIHGYFAGGLICEMPDGTDQHDGTDRLNPVHARVKLPADWRVALFHPRSPQPRVSGQLEQDNFAAIEAAPADRRETLQRLLTRRLIPAAREGDFNDFGDAVTEYNRLSGELFASIQGGPFNGREVADLVTWLIDRGAGGVGQSSWGPGVFAWFPSDEDAERLRRSLPDDAPDMTITRPRNRPRDLHLPAGEGPIRTRTDPNRIP